MAEQPEAASGPECLGLDLSDGENQTLFAWLAGSVLLSAERNEAKARQAFSDLAQAGLTRPEALAAADPERVRAVLAEVGVRAPEKRAFTLVRAARALVRDYAGSLERLHGQAEGPEDLGGRLAQLAPGFGAASVRRFLRGLRHVWPEVDELFAD